VSVEYDHQTQAQAALRWAAVATCERERLEWVRIALAWHDLATACATPVLTYPHALTPVLPERQ
jgi:hypothetical protein